MYNKQPEANQQQLKNFPHIRTKAHIWIDPDRAEFWQCPFKNGRCQGKNCVAWIEHPIIPDERGRCLLIPSFSPLGDIEEFPE